MAITEYNYIPKYIKRTIANKPKDVVTASYWNELFNLLINQGDHTAKELGNILNHFSTELAGIENEIAASAEDIANIRGVFRINVTYSNGVYTADKTFDEIKAAYDAGQLPYVVSGSNTIYTLTDCYLATEQMAMDFKRYLIGDDTLKDDTLRIYSYTTDNGSNIVRQNTEFNIPIKVLEVTLTTQNSVTVADKTFAQVETAVEDGIPVLKVHSDGGISWFFLLDKSPTEIDFIGFVDEQIIAYLTAKQDNTWETTVTARVTAEMLSALSDKLGNLGNLTTTAKNSLVGAINELKRQSHLGYLPVKLTNFQSDGSVFTCTADKTFAEVEAAAEGGKAMLGVDTPDGLSMCALIESGTQESGGKRWMEFIGLYIENSIVRIAAYSDDSWELQLVGYAQSAELNAVKEQIGSLSNLTTTEKSTVVAAINEVKADIPTKTSQLENDSGFLDSEDVIEVQMVDIPTKLSELDDDVGYLTLDTLPKYDGSVSV